MTMPSRLSYRRTIEARRRDASVSRLIRLFKEVDAERRFRRPNRVRHTNPREQFYDVENRNLDAFVTYLDELLTTLGRGLDDLLDCEYDRVQSDFPEFLQPRIGAPPAQSKYSWSEGDVIVHKKGTR